MQFATDGCVLLDAVEQASGGSRVATAVQNQASSPLDPTTFYASNSYLKVAR